MNEHELDLLRSYKNGPRIWDAASIVPAVLALAEQGLIEPVQDRGGAYQLTDQGHLVLAANAERPAGSGANTEEWRETYWRNQEETRYRYFVTWPGQPEQEVGVQGWRDAERAAGFHAGRPDCNATAGFTGISGISGRMVLADAEPWDDDDGSTEIRSEWLARFFTAIGVPATPMPRIGVPTVPGVWLGDDAVRRLSDLLHRTGQERSGN